MTKTVVIVGADQVALAGGNELARLRFGRHKDNATRTMAAGLTAIVFDLCHEGKLDGSLGLGETGGTPKFRRSDESDDVAPGSGLIDNLRLLIHNYRLSMVNCQL